MVYHMSGCLYVFPCEYKNFKKWRRKSGRDAALGVWTYRVMVCMLQGLFCNLPYGRCTLLLGGLYYFMDLLRCKYIKER